MSWAIILLILLVAFGPVLWLVPSKKDKRLAALRGQARTEGLLVEIRRIPKLNPEPDDRVSAGGKVRDPVVECASYSLPLNRRLSHLPGFRILKDPNQSTPDPLSGWTYDLRPQGDGRRHLDRMLELVADVLDKLPTDVAAFEVEPRTLIVFWREKAGSEPDTVSSMAEVLRRFAASLEALESEISAQIDINDS